MDSAKDSNLAITVMKVMEYHITGNSINCSTVFIEAIYKEHTKAAHYWFIVVYPALTGGSPHKGQVLRRTRHAIALSWCTSRLNFLDRLYVFYRGQCQI